MSEVVIVGTERGIGIEAGAAGRAAARNDSRRRAERHRRRETCCAMRPCFPAGLWDSEAILRRHRFAAAFGVGGYASGPMMLLAALQRIPTVVFEPNVEPGFTNRVLAAHRHARRRCVLKRPPRASATKPFVTGFPCAGILRRARQRASRAVPHPDHRRQPRRAADQPRRGRLARSSRRHEKISFSSCIRLANATIMRFAWRMRDANSSGGRPLHRKYGGAVCPGRPDRLPLGRDHCRGNMPPPDVPPSLSPSALPLTRIRSRNARGNAERRRRPRCSRRMN